MRHIIIHNHEGGNNHIVAKMISNHINCECVTPSPEISLKDLDRVIFIMPNTGDEELPQPMEDYLYNLNTKNKKYYICELGNYFGFENYDGCKKVAIRLLDRLNWQKIDDISLDSYPTLDIDSLQHWMCNLR